jgi:hypothetical protein
MASRSVAGVGASVAIAVQSLGETNGFAGCWISEFMFNRQPECRNMLSTYAQYLIGKFRISEVLDHLQQMRVRRRCKE